MWAGGKLSAPISPQSQKTVFWKALLSAGPAASLRLRFMFLVCSVGLYPHSTHTHTHPRLPLSITCKQ